MNPNQLTAEFREWPLDDVMSILLPPRTTIDNIPDVPYPINSIHWINSLIYGRPDTGKCHAKGTKLLMFDGKIKSVEDLKCGELLMGPDSVPRKIIKTSKGYGKLYKITPIKGDPWIVNEDHILVLVGADRQRNRIFHKLNHGKNIIEISVKNYLALNSTQMHHLKLLRTGVTFPSNSMLPLDPYILGVLLGDGCFRKTTIEVTNEDQEVIESLRETAIKYGLVLHELSHPNRCAVWSLASKEWTRKTINPITSIIKALDLWGTDSETKFIPFNYKTSTRNNRLQLLAGLMDTDGSKTNNCFDYISKSRQLTEDVIFLARSLGFAAYLTSCIKQAQNDVKGTYYRTCITGHVEEIPVKINRKKIVRHNRNRDVLRIGFAIQEVGIGEYYGFTLDGDGRYLLADFTITHNTELIRLIAEKAVQRYGVDMLAARNVGHNMDRFLDMPIFDKKPMQMFLFDDLTGIKLQPRQITTWFELRHSLCEKIGPKGLLMTFEATHEYFSIPKYLRQGINFLWIKSLPNPANTYDFTWLKRVVGNEAMRFLSMQEYDRAFTAQEKHYSVFKFLDVIGYTETPMATKDYLKGWAYWRGGRD